MDKKYRFDVIGLGVSAMDFLGRVPFYPDLDRRIRIEEFTQQGGGEAATAIVALSRFGAKTSFVGKIGDDIFGKVILNEFEKANVDTSHIIIEKGSLSVIAFCIIDKSSGKRTIFWYKELSPLNANELDKEFIQSSRILHIDQREPEASIQAAKWSKEAGNLVTADIDSYIPDLQTLLPFCDVVIGSETFANHFTSSKDYNHAADEVMSYGPKVVVFTLGESGCFCKSEKEQFYHPAFEVDVRDTTGCGDVFHGAFIFGILSNWGLRKTARFSNAAAAIKSTKIGGRAGIPTVKEVEIFLRKAKIKH